MEKKDIMVIRDPDVIKIITESTRRKILALLRVNDLSISQLSNLIEKDQSTVYRHIKKLEACGIVVPVGERKIHHIPETVYGRVARTYMIVPEIDDESPSPSVYYTREGIKDVMDVLNTMGYDIESRRIFSREMYRFSKKLDSLMSDDLKALEGKNTHIDEKSFINTIMILMLLKINENADLKDFMNRLGEMIKREE